MAFALGEVGAAGSTQGSLKNVDGGNWAIDPRGNSVAAGTEGDGSPRQVSVWTVNPFRQVAAIDVATSPVYMSDGKTLVCLSGDQVNGRFAVIWDTTRWAEQARVKIDALGNVYRIMAHPDGRSVLCHDEVYERSDESRDWFNRLDIRTLQQKRLFADNTSAFDWLVPSAPSMVLKTSRGMIHVWDLPPRKPAYVIWALALIAAFGANLVGPANSLFRALARRTVIPSAASRRAFGTLNVLFGVALLLVGGTLYWVFGHMDRSPPSVSTASWDNYIRFDLGSMIVLNALLVVSGFGLLWDRTWAAPVGVTTALLKLLRLVVVNVWLAVVLGQWIQYVLIYIGCLFALGSIYPYQFLHRFFRATAKPAGDLSA